MIDRGYPHYDFPINMTAWLLVANYVNFTKSSQVSEVQGFEVGSIDQIRPKHDSNGMYNSSFWVENIKATLEVVAPRTSSSFPSARPAKNDTQAVTKIEGEVFLDSRKRKFDENEMSLAFVLNYGAFRYYEGGDQEEHDIPGVSKLDSITPTAEAVGPVDVATANHHGRGTNNGYCDLLDPDVVMFQDVFSDQPLKSTMDLLIAPRKSGKAPRLFLTKDIYEERLQVLSSRY